MLRAILSGAINGTIAGAAGTTAINAATYADMVWRGRPPSTAPERTVDALADRTGHPVPGDGDQRGNRLTGLGAIAGIATGVGIGASAGLLRGAGLRLPAGIAALALGAAAMATTDSAMAALGVSDPRRWSRQDWLADALPHLVYGAVTAWALRSLTKGR
jgi:hypothetical protein